MCMTSTDYRTALASAVAEYEALGEQRRETDSRLAQLAQTIGTLSRLLGLTPTVPLSITDAVRLAMRAGVPMRPIEVRDRLLVDRRRSVGLRERAGRHPHGAEAAERGGRASGAAARQGQQRLSLEPSIARRRART